MFPMEISVQQYSGHYIILSYKGLGRPFLFPIGHKNKSEEVKILEIYFLKSWTEGGRIEKKGPSSEIDTESASEDILNGPLESF